ncbi:helix-turn-helix domain-containing protein [Salipiger aestuarii]|uniref:AraC family carnitine catabolism transcriptional activator n=1 Tax=Salipiger aestuarii TaxID=568098 RepID=A0A327Y6Z1_9RHOB|nr:helix-turn-helix domain-containing protein [Salipiger aestuarii]RAK15515.1 AraC family carnitine catabolism transcriptional activator [Salipiger aestuarii]
MQQHIELPVPLAQIAQALGVGRRRLERRVLADVRMTPRTAYPDLRLDRALRGTGQTVTEIAHGRAFCDGPNPARVLKARRGLSPAEYRRAQAASAGARHAVGVLLPPGGTAHAGGISA